MRSVDRPALQPTPYVHILVAVDGSRAAENAVRLALALVHGTPHALVTFCHVLDAAHTPVRTTQREAARAMLEPFCALARQRGISAQRCVRRGHPAAEIAAFAGLIRADLIVIGNRHKPRLRRLFKANTRDELIRTSRLPVLIADGEQLRAVRFRPGCVLMTGATDRPDADGAKRVARSVAQTFAARLVSSPVPAASPLRQMTAIEVAVRNYRPGLIVVPRPRRRGLWNRFSADLIERILGNAHIPVMVTHGG
jgi:nucleotide-binding universal stress UspA family protein